MTKNIETKGVSDIAFSNTDNPKVKVMTIKDGQGSPQHYRVNPELLGLLLQQALGLAACWADETSLSIDTLTGPNHCLPASHASVAMGRNDREVALNLFVGEVQMSYLISIDAMMNGLKPLVTLLDWSEVTEIKPN